MSAPKTERAHCPSCRALRPVRILGTATVARRPVRLAHCLDPACDLVWSIRTDDSVADVTQGASRQSVAAGQSRPVF